MSSLAVFSSAILATLLFVSSTMGHSQMRCAKYNTQTKECLAPIRNAGQSFLEEANDISTGKPICQSAWTNPITASYDGSASCGYPGCPQQMGTYTPGEVFNVMWPARNHAVADQTPGNITLYLSSAETVNQGKDVTAEVFQRNKFCTAPFMSCNGQNGDLVPCTASCTMPSDTQPGLYTLWWKWVWPGHTSVYSTCADILVVASTSKPQSSTTGAKSPAVPSTTGAKAPAAPSTTGAKSPAVPSTTGSQPVIPAQPSTTGVRPATPSTTGSAAAPTPTPSACEAGHMKCLTSETFSMCNFGAWGPSQSCAFGTQCSPNGNYIYCLLPSTPATPVPVPTTPSIPSTSTSSSSSDSSCTMGNQRCISANSYQTCGNGANGPTWSAAQFCQASLSCHESSTSKNIYCY